MKKKENHSLPDRNRPVEGLEYLETGGVGLHLEANHAILALH